FLEQVRKLGYSCSVFHPKNSTKHTSWSGHEMAQLIDWLATLPRPVAILARDDEQAHLVLDAAQYLSLRVPEDAAVLGIDNDEVFCQIAMPPLSSVDVNAAAIGYKAAELLAQRMKG